MDAGDFFREHRQATERAEALDQANRALRNEIKTLHELLRVVYDESLTLEEWRESANARSRLRVELVLGDEMVALSKMGSAEIAHLLSEKIGRMMAERLGGRVGGGQEISVKIGGRDAEQA